MTAGAAVVLCLLAGEPVDVLTLQVTVDPTVASGAEETALLRHLSFELAASRVAVVPAGAATTPPNARLAIGAVAGDSRMVSLDVSYLDSGTAVHRVVDLSTLPGDSTLLAIAVATDELLRASATLGRRAPVVAALAALAALAAPPTPPPLAPTPYADRDILLAGLVAGERHGGGAVALGADALMSIAAAPWLAVDARLGWRHGGPRVAPDGTVESRIVHLAVGGSAVLAGRRSQARARAALTAFVDGAWVTVHGNADTGATAYDSSGVGVALGAGLSGWVRLGRRLALIAFVGWQLPLRTVTATDGSTWNAPVFQPGLAAAAGAGARF